MPDARKCRLRCRLFSYLPVESPSDPAVRAGWKSGPDQNFARGKQTTGSGFRPPGSGFAGPGASGIAGVWVLRGAGPCRLAHGSIDWPAAKWLSDCESGPILTMAVAWRPFGEWASAPVTGQRIGRTTYTTSMTSPARVFDLAASPAAISTTAKPRSDPAILRGGTAGETFSTRPSRDTKTMSIGKRMAKV